MTQQQNPLRQIASNTQFSVDGGTANLVVGGVYGVEDIVKPLLTSDATIGDPRLFVTTAGRRRRIKWRRVNRDGFITPKAPARNDKDTVLQVRFAKPKRLNFISFQLLRVPQEWTVKYYDATRKRMVTLTDVNGKRVNGSLSGFKVNTLQPKQGSDGPKKWRTFSYKLPTIRTNLIELHLNRNVNNPPIENLDDFFGLPQDTPYSLGIRNLKVKMRIKGDDSDGDDGGETPIGTTERAIIKRHTSVMAHDGGEVTYWECAPQGAATSVVPYYMDVRQPDGSESVFDTLKLVPLWPGPSMSAYYSSDDATLPWTLSPNRVTLGTAGDTSPGFNSNGLLVTANDSSYVVDNSYLRYDTRLPLVVGLHWTPTVTNSANDRWLWNFEDGSSNQIGLNFDPTSQTASDMIGQFKVKDGSTTLATFGTSYTLNINQTYSVTLGYNSNDSDPTYPRGYYLTVSTAVPGTTSTITTQFSAGTMPTDTVPTTFRLGSNIAQTRAAQGYLSHVWARIDGFTQRVANSFVLNPDAFIAGEGDADQRTNGHYNGIFGAKFDETLEVRVGPGAGYYRSKSWTPLAVDYTLHGTQYELPVTKAKFLKLEFSNLAPRTYLTDLDELPVTDFPSWVKDWYRSVHSGGTPYGPVDPGRNFYEGVPTPRPRGDQRNLPHVREVLDGGGGGGMPPTIYHRDQATVDAVVNPELWDGLGTYKELQNATIPFRFMNVGHHEYETHYVSVQRRAFFVGIKELGLYRSDQSVRMDSPEYADTYEDEQYISSDVGWINVGSSVQSQGVDKSIYSVEFDSFSKFSTIQAAVLDSGWESQMTQAQIDLGDVTHLTDPTGTALGSSTSTSRSFVTGQYQGARGGNVIQLSRASGGTGDYGIRTITGLFDGFHGITGMNPRTSAVVRMILPETNLGTYELRLYAFDGEVSMQRRLVAKRRISIPTRSWQEIELAYCANEGESDFQAEVVQVNTTINEPFAVDMLGIWQAAVKWEFSNDGGTTYQEALWPLNKPNGYIRFKSADSRLKVRATSMRDHAYISGWLVIPWYIESPLVSRAPIDLNPPWGASDSEALRDTTHKPMFRLWNHWFPQSYSVNLYGYS